MLISLCTPVMNRLDDLRQVMPARIAEANASPPVELCILDAGSRDGLQEYMDELVEIARFVPGSYITYKRIEREYYHQAKAYNMAMLMGHGDYLVTIGADHAPQSEYIQALRHTIQLGFNWGYVDKTAIVHCKAEYFKAVGGYDERFEFYGPEDRDLVWRLRALFGCEGILPASLMKSINTPDDKKVANYRIPGNKHTFSKMMREFYLDNIATNTTVVNVGQEWGTWASSQ